MFAGVCMLKNKYAGLKKYMTEEVSRMLSLSRNNEVRKK